MIKTFAHRINAVKKILAGTAGQAEALAQWLKADYLTEFQAQFDLVGQIEDRRSALKARVQEETTTMEQAMGRLEGMAAFVKKVVRTQLPHETWPEFGFRKGEYAGKTVPENENQDIAG